MPVIAGYIYKDGERVRTIDLDRSDTLAMAPGEFGWIGISEPDEDEIQVLQQRFGLHPLAVEDAVCAHQLPKVDVYGEQLFVVAITAHLENEQLIYGETAIFVGANHIITVRHGSERGHLALREQLEAAPVLLRHGADYVLHSVLDFIVDGYLPVVEELEEEVLELERRALDAFLNRAEVIRIFNVRRDLLRFRRMLGAMEAVADRLQHHELPCIDPDVRPYFADVRDHVRRVTVMVDTLRDVLGSVFEAANLLEQQRQGHITRQLAAWAAILAVPTAIAGIYGMNFEHMPELHWRFGYALALLLMAGICALLWLRFRKANWL